MNTERQWTGFWIRYEADPAPYLRKRFELTAMPENAFLHLCGLGWHELYVNGRKADDRVLAPAVSQFDKHVSYISYDVTSLLKAGKNAITVLLGNGWYNCRTQEVWNFVHAVWLDSPKMLCDLECDGKIVMSSDDSWKVHPSPILFNQLRNGEKYDARLEISGVYDSDFDDSCWRNADYCNPPGGVIVKEEMEPCRICAKIAGTPHEFLTRELVYDFGVNLTGWCELEAEGPAGAEIVLIYSERILDNGDITRENISMFIKGGDCQTDRYFLKGNGKEVWHPRFTYHGFRYCKVCWYVPDVKVNKLTAHFIHNDFVEIGKFESSSKMLNTLQKITRQSYLSNYTGIPTDCPHREKNGWTGDAQLTMETGLWNFDVAKAIAHFEQVLADTQRPNGQLPGIAPASGWGYNWGSGPAWDIYLFEAPARIALFTGNDALFLRYLPQMELYLDYCRSMAHEGGLVAFGLGDWCCYDHAKMTPPELTCSAYYFYAAKLISRYKPEYANTAEAICAAINRKYYKGNGIYANGERTAMACALYFGIAEESERSKVADALVMAIRKSKHKAGFGILGAKYIPRALADYGYADDAFQVITQPEFPGWGWWVNHGATSLHESWNSSSSLNHIMFGDISAWMYQYAAGIVPLAATPGFSHFRLAPCFINGLDFVRAEHRSPFGMIRVSWKRTANGIEYECEIPKGSTADLCVNGKTEQSLTGHQTRSYQE